MTFQKHQNVFKNFLKAHQQLNIKTNNSYIAYILSLIQSTKIIIAPISPNVLYNMANHYNGALPDNTRKMSQILF